MRRNWLLYPFKKIILITFSFSLLFNFSIAKNDQCSDVFSAKNFMLSPHKLKEDESWGNDVFQSNLESISLFFSASKNLPITQTLERLLNADVRKSFFKLQSLSKVYENLNPDEFKQLRNFFKASEDALGRYALQHDLRTMAEKIQNQDLLNFFISTEIESQKNLSELLQKQGWVNQPEKLSSDLKNKMFEINTLDNAKQDKKFLIENLTSDTNKLSKEIDESKFDEAEIEKGLHELRRRLRWLLIQIGSMDGYTVRQSETDLSPAVENLYQQINRTYGNLEQKIKIASPSPQTPAPIVIPRKIELILSYYVKVIGDFKDKAEVFIAFDKAMATLNFSQGQKDKIFQALKTNLNSEDVDHRKLANEFQKSIRETQLLKEFALQLDKVNE